MLLVYSQTVPINLSSKATMLTFSTVATNILNITLYMLAFSSKYCWA